MLKLRFEVLSIFSSLWLMVLVVFIMVMCIFVFFYDKKIVCVCFMGWLFDVLFLRGCGGN